MEREGWTEWEADRGKKLAFSVIRKRRGEKVVRENPGVRHREKSPDLGRGKKKSKDTKRNKWSKIDPESMGMSNKKVKRKFFNIKKKSQCDLTLSIDICMEKNKQEKFKVLTIVN